MQATLFLIFQPIENVLRLANKTVTVSFLGHGGEQIAQSSGVSLDQIFGTGGSPSANVLGNGQARLRLSDDMDALQSLSFTLPSIAGKVLGTGSNDFTELVFWYSSGSN